MTVCARACARVCVCAQQTAVFSSLLSVNQPKENQVFCETPELASCLGAGGVFHSDSVFPTPSHTCARPHTVFKIRLSLPIKTTGGAGGCREDLPSNLPQATRSIPRPPPSRPPALLCIVLVIVAAFNKPRHSTVCARDRRKNEQSRSQKVKLRKIYAQKREPSLDFQNVLSYIYVTERHREKKKNKTQKLNIEDVLAAQQKATVTKKKSLDSDKRDLVSLRPTEA